MRYLGIIPARGGSKRLPDKNIKSLGGKPLIYHTIDVCKEIYANCAGLMDFYVSTEDAVIKHLSLKREVLVIDRPEDLAKDDTTTGEVALHALETLESRGQQYDAVVILHPTSPFRTAQHINEAINASENGPYARCASVTLKEKKHECVNGLSKFGNRAFNKAFIMNGAIYIIKNGALKLTKEHASFYNCVPYFMDKWSSVDIDDEFDWLVAEAVYENKNPHKSTPAATCDVGEWGATPSYASADRIRMEVRTRDSASGVPSHHLSRREGSLGPGDNFWDSPSEACGTYSRTHEMEAGVERKKNPRNCLCGNRRN